MTAILNVNNPLLAGLKSARANFIPGLLVQALMALVVAAYYLYPPARDWFQAVGDAKARLGFGFSIAGAAIAGALIPELLKIVCFQRGKPTPLNARNLMFTVPYWAYSGFVVDAFYRGQALWFGTAVTTLVIAKKVLIDQFVFNVVYQAPITVIAYDWKNGGYSLQGAREWFARKYYAQRILPGLVATWGVWIPLVCLIYALPSLLQTPLFTLALSLWVMIFTWMSEQKA